MPDPQAQFVLEPIVAASGEMTIIQEGVDTMLDWVRSRAPACLPDDYTERGFASLFPHDLTRGPDGGDEGKLLSDNELIVELAGRKCYNSFGAKAGRKSNSEYIANMQAGDVPHASVLYHAKMSFFIAGVSRRVSHELIRNYVGADRDEEGSPSQESTRYVENAGHYVVHPRYLGEPMLLEEFKREAERNYQAYRHMVGAEIMAYEYARGERPKGIAYKRILEAASSLLLHSVETSFVWTTNAGALAKLFRERAHAAADLEFERFARKWKAVCLERWPNLFPQPWMREPQVPGLTGIGGGPGSFGAAGPT